MATTRKTKAKAAPASNGAKKLTGAERATLHNQLAQRPESQKALAEGDAAWEQYQRAIKDR